MKNLKLSQKQISELLGISPPAVGGLVKRNKLFRNSDGLFDLNFKENRAFVEDRGIDLKKIKIPNPIPSGRPIKPAPQGEIKSARPETMLISTAELQRKHLQKKIEKLDQEIAAKKKILLPADFIQNFIFRYIERLNANIERIASVGIQDIGNDILEAGEVLPAHIQTFTNLTLEAIHNTKKGIMKEIEKYEPNK